MRRRPQDVDTGPAWPVFRSQVRQVPSPLFEVDTVADDFHSNTDALLERGDGESRSPESWLTEAAAPAPMQAMVSRHANFLGRDVLPSPPLEDSAPLFEDAVGVGTVLPLAMATRSRFSARPVDHERRDVSRTARESLNEPAQADRAPAAFAGDTGHVTAHPPSYAIRGRGLATSRMIPARMNWGQFPAPLIPSEIQHDPRRLSLRLPFAVRRDALEPIQPSGHAFSQIQAARLPVPTFGTISERGRAPRPLLRRQFALASATDAAQAVADAEESSRGPLGSLGRWLPTLTADAPPRPLARLRLARAVDAPMVSGRAIDGHAPLRSLSTPSGPLDELAMAVDTPPARHMVVTRTVAGDSSETRFDAAGRPSAPAQSRVPYLPVDWVVARRLAAHDEPFASTMRQMHATAINHILRRRPPTSNTTPLVTSIAKQPHLPARTVEEAVLATPTPAHFRQQVIRSLPVSAASNIARAEMVESAASPFAAPLIAPAQTRRFPNAQRDLSLPGATGRQTARPRIVASLRSRRVAGDSGQPVSQYSAIPTRFIAEPETSFDDGRERPAANLPMARSKSPAAIARALTELLGDNTTEPVAAMVPNGPRRMRPPAINATFAAVLPASTLPPPAPRGPAWPAHGGAEAQIGTPFAGQARDLQVPASLLSPFVAGQIARASTELRRIAPRSRSIAGRSAMTGQNADTTEQSSVSRPARSVAFTPPLARMPYSAPPDQWSTGPADPGEPESRPFRAAPAMPSARGETGIADDDSVRTNREFGGATVPRREHSPFPAAGSTGAGAMPRPIYRRFGNAAAQPNGQPTPFERLAQTQWPGMASVFRRLMNEPDARQPSSASDLGAGQPFPAVQFGWPRFALTGTTASTPAADLPPVLRRPIDRQIPSAQLSAARRHGPLVFRSAIPSASDPTVAQRSEAADAMAQSTGQPLPPLVRRSMEHLFRMDLATIRVHSGPHAARATDLVAARAMASGPNVFLPGGISDAPQGEELPLLAHELTHVAQHFGHRPPTAARSAPLTLAHRAADTEQDAERVERMVSDTIRRQPAITSMPPALTLARKPAPVTIMRVDEPPPAPSTNVNASAATPSSQQGSADSTNNSKDGQNPQKLADQIFQMLEQRLIVARERGGHRF